jgi:predicted O-methyltransferase YrrM
MVKRLEKWLRLGLLIVDRLSGRALLVVQQHARALEIRLDRIADLTIAPLDDIECPRLDFLQLDDPVPAILDHPSFIETERHFAQSRASSRSLVSSHTQALLYTVARNLRPDHVLEIGVYKAATTEAIARALHANGRGRIHAIDPFRTEYISAILKQWPAELAARVAFHATSSVEFFAAVQKRGIVPMLVLVDGNHAYEFAYFDICSAARLLGPRGLMFIDNISQPGPFLAARDFLRNNPGWLECGGSPDDALDKPFDPQRSRIRHTDLLVLRAPQHQHVGARPWSLVNGLTGEDASKAFGWGSAPRRTVACFTCKSC